MQNPSDTRTFHELQPVLPLSEAWHWLMLVAVLALLVFGCVWLYRRDTKNLSRPIAWLLTSLRLFAILLMVVYLLGPERRTETKLIKDSKVAVLFDTSLSMGLSDEADPGSASNEMGRPLTRSEQVIAWLKKKNPFERLRDDHQVAVWRFDADNRPYPVATFSKKKPAGAQDSAALEYQVARNDQRASVVLGMAAVALLGLACLGLLYGISLVLNRSSGAPPFVAASIAIGIIGGVLLSLCDLRTPQLALPASLGWTEAVAIKPPMPVEALDALDAEPEKLPSEIDWETEIAPRGVESRLGSAVDFIVTRELASSLAGIVMVTDGQENGGTPAGTATASATNAGIPLYPLGVGSTRTPQNIEVVDVQAPPRVYPGDKFKVKAIVTAFGLEGASSRIRLLSVDEKETEAPVEEAAETFRIKPDGEPTTVTFELQRTEQGKRKYTVFIEPLESETDDQDNSRTALVEIVQRRTNVLLIAGGPMREYRFLRNQLYRDTSITTHVWLQSAKAGADQESDVFLDSFPKTRDELYFFDCVIAFDPDWSALSAQQSALLERWVAEQAGGLVVVAGPVNTPEWTRKPRGNQTIDPLRKLYPVSFYSQGSSILKVGRFGGKQAYPLEFTREGRAAEFLWLGDTIGESDLAWTKFAGVFGYYAVNEAKPGADVLANFADPDTIVGDRLPIYMASQFYGAGRVFFQASGEMWRVRKLDVAWFESYYNKLIRWASQGRLIRDSRRGVLLTDKKRCWMGDNVSLRAILRDAQDQPLELEEVTATILRPDDTSDRIVLRAGGPAARAGTFSAQFAASVEGDYRITLPIPDSPDLEVLTTNLTARIPDLEKEKPQRNDQLLTAMAEKTGGHYFVGLDAFSVDDSDSNSPKSLIQPMDQETFLSGSFDRQFKRKLMMWTLGLFVTALSIEWIVRRLHRLA